jgi:hypothetical protein
MAPFEWESFLELAKELKKGTRQRNGLLLAALISPSMDSPYDTL